MTARKLFLNGDFKSSSDGDCANEQIDPAKLARYSPNMNAVEFITQLSGATVLQIPSEAAAQLPKAGRARVIVLTDEDASDAEWRSAAYEQFLREDSSEDAIYDSLR
jgi:hypothetical protein